MHFHVSLLDDDRPATSLPRQRRELVARTCCTRSAACRPRWRNRCWSLPRTPIPGAASCRSPMRRSRRPGASTTARWRCACRPATSKNRRIEHRPSGVDANPYLVAATVLAGIAKGLDEKLDPGPETTGNGYETAPTRRDHAADWRSAIEAAKASAFLQAGARRGPAPHLHRDQAGRISARRPHRQRTRLPPLSARGLMADRVRLSNVTGNSSPERTYHERMTVLIHPRKAGDPLRRRQVRRLLRLLGRGRSRNS